MVEKRKAEEQNLRPFEKMATTYSRASYTGTTIGNAAFDVRVRNGIGSDHCFIVTKKFRKNNCSLKTVHSSGYNSLPKIARCKKQSDQASRSISISPLNALLRLHA